MIYLVQHNPSLIVEVQMSRIVNIQEGLYSGEISFPLQCILDFFEFLIHHFVISVLRLDDFVEVQILK